MHLTWKVAASEARAVRQFLDRHRGNRFVRERVRRNVRTRRQRISRESFWRALVMCMLTTQQRSGPGSPVSRFLAVRPFPLGYERCRRPKSEAFIGRTLTHFRGIRRARTIARQAEMNLRLLAGETWTEANAILRTIVRRHGAAAERTAARFMADRFHGLGPKQSRNLLQHLGLTRHEIPIDSRITKWLNARGFPVHLNATALSDPDYYDFVLDGFQTLCRRARIYPCVLDAAIFSSFDEAAEDQSR